MLISDTLSFRLRVKRLGLNYIFLIKSITVVMLFIVFKGNKMRLWALLVLSLLMVGCAGQKPKVEVETKPVLQVTPLNITLPNQYRFSPYSDYISPLLSNLTQESFYNLSNPQLLIGGYNYSHEVISSDHRKTVFVFESLENNDWGYITTGIGRKPIANAFLIEGSSLGSVYGLVLKQTKICFVSQANGYPVVNGTKWSFSSSPGLFECTGLTNTSIFGIGTGLPGLLGPYVDEKDTVFVFRSWGQLQQVLWALKHQFPTLVIPVIGR